LNSGPKYIISLFFSSAGISAGAGEGGLSLGRIARVIGRRGFIRGGGKGFRVGIELPVGKRNKELGSERSGLFVTNAHVTRGP
jgi:hypothetical protein